MWALCTAIINWFDGKPRYHAHVSQFQFINLTLGSINDIMLILSVCVHYFRVFLHYGHTSIILYLRTETP